MNRTITMLILICSFCIQARGQVRINNKPIKKGKSQIVASVYNGAIINGLNDGSNDTYPNPIRMPSALSYSGKVSLDFERITRHNLIFGFGLEFGSISQNFDVVYESFDYADTTAALRQASASNSYRNKSNYFAARATVGYSFPLHLFKSSDYSLDTKFTLSKSFIFNGGSISEGLTSDLDRNDTLYFGWYDLSSVYGKWGNQGMSFYGPFFTEYNIGIKKNMNSSLLGDLYIGMYASCNAGTYFGTEKSSMMSVSNGHYLNGQYLYSDTDYLKFTDFTVGLRIGIGLKL